MTDRSQHVTSVTRSLPASPADLISPLISATPPAPPTPTLESAMHHIPEQMARNQQAHRLAEAQSWRVRRAAVAARRAESAERRARLAREAAVLAHQSAYADAR